MVRISWSRAANVRKDKTYVIRSMPFPKTTRIVKAIHQRCLVEDNHRLLGHMLIFAVVCMHGKTIRPLCNSNMHNSDILSTVQLGVKVYIPANNPLFILTYIFLWKGGCISKEKNYFKDAIAQSLRRITYNIAEAYHFQLVKSLKIGVRERKKSRGSYCSLPSYWLVICRYFFGKILLRGRLPTLVFSVCL